MCLSHCLILYEKNCRRLMNGASSPGHGSSLGRLRLDLILGNQIQRDDLHRRGPLKVISPITMPHPVKNHPTVRPLLTIFYCKTGSIFSKYLAKKGPWRPSCLKVTLRNNFPLAVEMSFRRTPRLHTSLFSKSCMWIWERP
jgi:hypothetical protein